MATSTTITSIPIWNMIIYNEANCTSGYYVVTGHNSELLEDQCINFYDDSIPIDLIIGISYKWDIDKVFWFITVLIAH